MIRLQCRRRNRCSGNGLRDAGSAAAPECGQQRSTPPAATNHSRLHAGIDRPRNVQSTLAHSPEPVRTLRITSVSGLASIMKFSGGPHDGTWSGRQVRQPHMATGDADADAGGDQAKHAIGASSAGAASVRAGHRAGTPRRARRRRCAGRCTAGTDPADSRRGTGCGTRKRSGAAHNSEAEQELRAERPAERVRSHAPKIVGAPRHCEVRKARRRCTNKNPGARPGFRCLLRAADYSASTASTSGRSTSST